MMSQPSRILPQSKETLLKSYTKRLKDDVKSILDNFTEIVKSSKVCALMYTLIQLMFFNRWICF